MRLFISGVFAVLVPIFLFTSCEDETLAPSKNTNQIDFSTPKAGQEAYFQRYASICDNINGSFQFTGDTLVLELTNEQGQFYLNERFTESSPLYLEGNTDPIRHKISFQEDYALIPERSNSALFFFYGNDTIRLKPMQRETMTQSSCRINFNEQIFTGDEIGNINRFEIGPLIETDKMVVACIPIGFNIDAYLIYDENRLLMSHTVDFQGSITGWSYID